MGREWRVDIDSFGEGECGMDVKLAALVLAHFAMWRIAAAVSMLVGAIAWGAESELLEVELDKHTADFHDRLRQYEFEFLNPGVFNAFENSKYQVSTPRRNQIEFRRGNAIDHFAVPQTMKFGKAAYSADGRFMFIIAKGWDLQSPSVEIRQAFLFELKFDPESQDLFSVSDVSAKLPQSIQSERYRVLPDANEIYSVSGDGTKVLLEASFSFRIKSQPKSLFTRRCPVLIDLAATEEDVRSGASTLTATGSVAKLLQEFDANWDSLGDGFFDQESVFNKNSNLQLFGSSRLAKLHNQGIDIIEETISEWEIRRGESRVIFRVPRGEEPDGSDKQFFWGEPVVSANESTLFVLCNEGTPEQGHTPVELWKIDLTYDMEKHAEGPGIDKVMETTGLLHPNYKQIELTELFFVDGGWKRFLGNCLLLKSLPEEGSEFAYYRPFLIDVKTKGAVEATADNFPSFVEGE